MSFSEYKFSPEIMSAIEAQGYTAPTPIQAQALPHVLQGKDVLGLAQTGTGKTAAFVLPMLQRLMGGDNRSIRGLIIAPTRELAEQIHETIIELGRNTGLRSVAVYGGVSFKTQFNIIKNGVDILVACPGRLLDHIQQRTVLFKRLEVLVLDEADHMFDMGFLPAINAVLKYIPPQRQTLLFSATMPDPIRKLAHQILKSPITVEVEHKKVKDSIAHTFFPVKTHLKTPLLLALLNQTATRGVLIFTRTKHRAKTLDDKLQKLGFKSASLQGNLSQNRRQAALNGFKDGEFDIMVATDIAARGIDVSRVSHVINYDVPDTFEAYTHRIGRTGRAERTGDAYSFVTPEDDDMLNQMKRHLGSQLSSRVLDDFDYDAPKPEGPAEFGRPPLDPRAKQNRYGKKPYRGNAPRKGGNQDRRPMRGPSKQGRG